MIRTLYLPMILLYLKKYRLVEIRVYCFEPEVIYQYDRI